MTSIVSFDVCIVNSEHISYGHFIFHILSEQKFSFFIASTDLRVISKLLQQQICPLKAKQKKDWAFRS